MSKSWFFASASDWFGCMRNKVRLVAASLNEYCSSSTPSLETENKRWFCCIFLPHFRIQQTLRVFKRKKLTRCQWFLGINSPNESNSSWKPLTSVRWGTRRSSRGNTCFRRWRARVQYPSVIPGSDFVFVSTHCLLFALVSAAVRWIVSTLMEQTLFAFQDSWVDSFRWGF